MKILFVCHRLPFPPHQGGKIRPFNMIRHLHRDHSIVVASLAHTDEELIEGAGLGEYCDEVIAEVLPTRARWLQATRALATPTPSSVAYFRSARLHQRIRQKLLTQKFDVIFVHCAFVAQYVANWQRGLRILDFGDLDSVKWADYSRMRAFPLSLGYALESRKLRRYELAVARQFDRCMVTTQGELEEFQKLGAAKPCGLVPNGVDTTYFVPNVNSEKPPTAIVFLGRMDYFPNSDGIRYFVREIFPMIRSKRPDVSLRIIGSHPPRSVQELAKIPNVSVTGNVLDVRPYLTVAALSVAPLRIARGTQNKILESMAMGVPVVATSQAAKGIQATPGKHLLVADQPSAFAQHVINLLENEALRRRIAAAAHVQVANMHVWPASLRILDDLLEAATADRTAVTRSMMDASAGISGHR